MADFKNINDFRKGNILRKINEDPTYLSFFILFDTINREESPLFSGPAKDYLDKVLNPTYSKKHSIALENFQKVLIKINRELPWFWQTLSGLEGAMTYENLTDPYRGGENSKIEIECLEENVELTAIGLMDLYKRACYDFERYVEVLPHNLRHFSMYVFVTEVRKFQTSTNDANLGKDDNPDTKDNSSRTEPKILKTINQDFTLEAKPFIQLKFSHCEFDIDSIAPMFADISKNPELKKPKIGIKWGAVSQINQKLGANLVTEEDPNVSLDSVPIPDKYNTSPFDPKDFVQGKLDSAVQGAKDSLTNKFNNLKDGILGGNNSDIGNAYGDSTGALVSGALGQVEEKLLASLFLGNVHGAGSASTFQDAIRSGSLNSIANIVTDLFGSFGRNNNPTGDNISPSKIYPEVVLQSDELAQERIHPEGIDSSPDVGISENIHPQGTDSTPDGNLNENVYE